MNFDSYVGVYFYHILFSFILGSVILMFFHLFLRTRQHLVEIAPKSLLFPRAYTLEELSEYDGVQKPMAFVAVRGIVYKCSVDFYGANAPYNAFSGRDSSRHLGKMKVGREESNADWTTLSAQHLDMLDEWEDRLRSKYEAVGWIIPSADFSKRAESFEP